MIKRYQLTELEPFLSDLSKYQRWTLLEREVLYSLSKALNLPPNQIEELEKILDKLTITPEEVEKEEKITKHDFVAFLRILEKKLSTSPIAKFLHYGLTSSDIIDTANSLLLRELNDFLVKKIESLEDTLYDLSYRYLDTLQVGRTHGRHAEPVSFGYKFAITFQELEKSLEQLYLERRFIEVVTVKGSTGTYSHISPEVQEDLANRLRLFSIFGSTQAFPRNRYASYLSTLSCIARVINSLALNLRTLCREEISELSLNLSEDQVGSSSMPHKVNPVTLENISGLTRWIHGIASLSFENIELWDERDISHSSNERMSLLDVPILLGNILTKMNDFLKQLTVNKEQLEKNLHLTKGVISSQVALLALINSPEISTRKIATQRINQLIDTVREGKASNFLEALSSSREGQLIKATDLSRIENFNSHLKYLPVIYQQIFSKSVKSKHYTKTLSISQYELNNAIYYLAQRINWYYNSKNIWGEDSDKVIVLSLSEKITNYSGLLLSFLSFPLVSISFNSSFETIKAKYQQLEGINPLIVEELSKLDEYHRILTLSKKYSRILILAETEDNEVLLETLFSSLSTIEGIKEIKCASLLVQLDNRANLSKKDYYRSSLFSLDYTGFLSEKKMREYNFKNWTKDHSERLINWYGLLLQT